MKLTDTYFGLPVWAWGAFGATVLVAVMGRKQIALGFRAAVSGAEQLAFKLALPKEGQPYASVILQVASEQSMPPSIVAALMEQETYYGTGAGYTPKGPAGKGDGGHGYGLMQIDDRSNGTWLAENQWQDPLTNVRRGVQILKGKMNVLSSKAAIPSLTDGNFVTLGSSAAQARGVAPGQYRDPRPLTGDALFRAALAAYNTGEGNVIRSLAAGKSPDITTADKTGYMAHVLARAERIENNRNA